MIYGNIIDWLQACSANMDVTPDDYQHFNVCDNWQDAGLFTMEKNNFSASAMIGGCDCCSPALFMSFITVHSDLLPFAVALVPSRGEVSGSDSSVRKPQKLPRHTSPSEALCTYDWFPGGGPCLLLQPSVSAETVWNQMRCASQVLWKKTAREELLQRVCMCKYNMCVTRNRVGLLIVSTSDSVFWMCLQVFLTCSISLCSTITFCLLTPYSY